MFFHIATAALRGLVLLAYFLGREVLIALWLCLQRLLGLQPGVPQPQNFTHSISLRNNSRRRRRRPPRRTVRRWLRRRMLRLVIPCIVRLCWTSVGVALQRLWSTWWHQRHAHSVEPGGENRCIPTAPVARVKVNLEQHGWFEMPQDRMRCTVLEAMRTWCRSVSVDSHVEADWSKLIHACLTDSVKTALKRSRMFEDVIQLMAVICCVLESGHVTWEHVQSFTVIARSLANWIFPQTVKSKRSTSAETDLLWILGGCCRLLLITAWQASGGKRKRARAFGRCVGLDPLLQAALLHSQTWSAPTKMVLAQFLCLHVLCVLQPVSGHAVLYQLSSAYHEYIGSTKFGAHKTACRGDAPVQRSYQHVLEHRRFRLDKTGRTTPKLRLFGRLHASDHMFWVLSVSVESHIRALEDAAIRCWQKKGNCRSTGGCAVARARHSVASRQQRSRPTCRPGAKDSRCFDAHRAQWLRVSASLCHTKSRHLCDESLQVVATLPFHKAYVHLQKHLLLNGFGAGPIDIYGPFAKNLLVRYVADSRVCCWESLEQRHRRWTCCSKEWAVHMGKLLLSCPKSATRQRALNKLSMRLRVLGLKAAKLIHLPWPACCPRKVFWSVLHCFKKAAYENSDWASVWMCMLVRPAHSKSLTFASAWQFIPSAKKFRDKTLLTCRLAKLKPSQIECLKMTRAKLHWGVPVLSSLEHVRQVVSSTLYSLAEMVHFGPSQWLEEIVSHTVPWLACQAEDCGLHEQYADCFPACPDGYVFVQEDKDRNAAWLMPLTLYARWCFFMFRQDDVHWVPFQGSVAEAVEAYRRLHSELLPSHLKRFSAKSRWRSFELPYAYCTLKAKCFAEGIGHVCTKSHHSCLRRIVSWKAHPAKALYRGASRAIVGLIWVLGLGFETRNLHTAVKDFAKACDRLARSSDNLCCKCSNPFAGLSLVVCDAAQMYEEISPRMVFEAVDLLITLAKNRYENASGVAVARTRRLHCWVVQGSFRNRPNATVWCWSDIMAVLKLALQQPLVRLGKFLFEQVRGVPIGGHMSKAIASSVLAVEELRWSEDVSKQRAWGFPVDGSMSFCNHVAASRYVDDTALASGTVCSSCLAQVPSLIYREPICFEPTKPGDLGHPWLDVWLFDDRGRLGIRADGVEVAWRAAGGQGYPTKHRLKPYLGPAACCQAELRSLAAGRLVRWKSMDLQSQRLREAVATELQFWVLYGYPRPVMEDAWLHLPHFPEASKLVRSLLAQWKASPHLPVRCRAWWQQ